MKVSNLIEVLQQEDPNAEVIFNSRLHNVMYPVKGIVWSDNNNTKPGVCFLEDVNIEVSYNRVREGMFKTTVDNIKNSVKSAVTFSDEYLTQAPPKAFDDPCLPAVPTKLKRMVADSYKSRLGDIPATGNRVKFEEAFPDPIDPAQE